MKEQAKKAPQSETVNLELVAELFYRQYDILYRLTTQMLATKNLDDKLSLVLDAVTSELGFSHSAIALTAGDTGELRIRLALGFPDDDKVIGSVVPVFGSSRSFDKSGRPAWIRRANNEAENRFLEAIGSTSDILSLPLFGGQWLEVGDIDQGGQSWLDTDLSVDNSRSIGMLYIACSPENSTSSSVNLLLRLAD